MFVLSKFPLPNFHPSGGVSPFFMVLGSPVLILYIQTCPFIPPFGNLENSLLTFSWNPGGRFVLPRHHPSLRYCWRRDGWIILSLYPSLQIHTRSLDDLFRLFIYSSFKCCPYSHPASIISCGIGVAASHQIVFSNRTFFILTRVFLIRYDS